MNDIEDIYELSPIQQGMLFHSALAPDSGAYIVQMLWTLDADLDVRAFRQAWDGVVRRHTALRTAFHWQGLEKPLQVVHRSAPVEWTVRETPAQGESDDERLQAFLDADRRAGFDPGRAPLLRAALFRYADGSFRFVLTNHHLLMDGWSLPLVLHEVFLGYEAAVRGNPPPPLPHPRPFRDYILWLQAHPVEEAETFWRGALAGLRSPTPLPFAAPAGAAPSTPDAEEGIRLSAEVCEGLERVARRAGVTLNTVMQGAWALLLEACTGEADVLFGATSSGRPPELEGVERMVGMFINAVPVRVQVDAGRRLHGWLQEVQERQARARAHEHAPLTAVHGWSEVPRSQPLFETLLVFESYPVTSSWREGGSGRLRVRGARSLTRTNYPLTMLVVPGERWNIRAMYASDRLDEGSARRILRLLANLLERIAAGEDLPLHALSPMDADERRRVLVEWNDTGAPAGPPSTVHALVGEQAARTPDAPALEWEGGSLGYRELEERTNRLARRLRAAGVGPESRVGVMLERGEELPVALLAILKAGGAYVPLDPEYPAERLAFMLRDAGASVLLTHAALRERVDAPRVLVLDSGEERAAVAGESADALEESAGPESLAYIVYTSGSTGTPKGVMVPHRAIVRLVRGSDFAPLGGDDRVAQLSNASFDAATWEVWGALTSGAALVLVPRDAVLDPAALAMTLRTRRITALFLTTALFNQVARHAPDAFSGVRHLLFGGEQVDPAAVRGVLEGGAPGRLLHVYGPTENTTFSTWHRVEGVDDGAHTVPIGRAVARSTAYTLDAALRAVPVGVWGELYVGGEGVARGYGGRPGLTAERFVPDAFSGQSGARLYRTGDRVRWTEEGALEFGGRFDQQLKIRGFRIEPGEVEAAIREVAGVLDAAVVPRDDAHLGRHLAAFYTAQPELTPTRLREELRTRLPEYMVPGAVVRLEELPLNPNGKVDRHALPDSAAHRSGGAEERGAPRGPVEELLAEVFAEVLGVERVGTRESFFDLGGHSLVATRAVSRIHGALGVEIPLRALFENPTVEGLAVEVERLRGAPVLPPIVPTGRTGPLPLSFAQERLWFLGQLQPGDTSYNVPAAFILSGPLDVDALGRALSEIVRRHEVLRTVLPPVDGAPAQVILPAEPLPLPVHGPVPREELGRIAAEEAGHAFDLTTGPLLRARLVRLEGEEHALFLTMHHVVFDGWSVGVLLAELSALYSAYAAGEPSPLPELPVQYGDYAVWQREHLAGEQLERQLDYWKTKLAGAPEVLELPTDRPRAAVQRHRGAVKRVMVPADAARAVKELVRGEESTPFMGLLAAWQALLGRYAGQREVVVGTPIAGRTRSEVEPLIGFFVNTLALRTDLAGNPSFRQLLARVRETTLDAYAHQDLPFERLVAEVKPARTLSHAPVFQTTFTYEGAWARADRAPAAGVSMRSLSGSEPDSSKFDLSLVATERSGGALQLTLTYDRDLFEAATAERLLDRYTRLLEQVAAAPDRPLAALPLLSADEREAVLRRAAPRREPCAPETIHSLVEASAALTPDAVAVAGGGTTLTYAELDARANRFAHYLRARFGVATETRVAVFMERSPELVVALLGILKAGGVYVPLDPAHPDERNRWILEDSGARVLVAGAAPGAWISPTAARVLELELAAAEIAAAPESHPGVEVHPDQLAYVVYTSGSTGRPKGVLGVHRGAANFLRYVVESYALGPDDAVLQMAGASFDASFRDTIGPLAAGARVLFAGKEAHSDPGRLLAVVAEQRPTAILSIVPSVLRAHVAHAEETGWAASSLRLMLLSGEPLAATDCRRARAVFGPQLTLVNQYGPTETTMTATFFPVTEPPADGTQLPVGEPIRNVELYVLDDTHDLVPDGVAGELCIGGVGVTRGYANRPGLTAQLFIPHPWPAEPGARLYRTGDLFRRECDGTLRFLGRRDQQVKVRGVRVEPGEVEAALRAHPALRDAAVAALPQGDGSTRLRAFWTAADGAAPDAGSLRAFLRERLPEALVPEEYVQLPALPRTPNGKLDRGALPLDAVTARPAYEAPRTAVEEVLALLLAELLETEVVGRDDDFFALGGHSLTAMRLAARVRAALRAELPLMAVFAHPTPRGMAEQLVAHEAAPGRVEQVARLYLKVVRMSDGEVAAGLERETLAGSPAR